MPIKYENLTNSGQSNRSKIIGALILAAIILLGAFLRFYQLGATSIGNAYYGAAVKSMLTSWFDFFFVAFEPGGSLAVDKPPLGLWMEAISAGLMGMNGFALAFPNALAGTLSIPLLYFMVKKQFGLLAGLAAGLALAVTPIAIATERNNTMDGMLVFTLLLAAWAVWKSVESGQHRYLLLGFLFVGLGFNIKMLQAYMVLPALYTLYLLGARHGWRKRIVHCCTAAVLLLVVSLAWALVVDGVPAERRPYIGSSLDNSVTELIVGHNGIQRLLGGSSYQQVEATIAGNDQSQGQTAAQNINIGNPKEVGTAGVLRLFTEPLASQASWLFPLVLMGLGLTLWVIGRPFPFNNKHLALVLWGGWLAPMALYFAFTPGLWHPYYLIMLGPALAALVGAAFWAFEQLFAQKNKFGWGIVALLSGLTLGFEIFVLSDYPDYVDLASILMIIPWLIGLVALIWNRRPTLALGLVMLSLMGGPLLWSGLTTFNTQPEVDLPKAGPLRGQPGNDPLGLTLTNTQLKVKNYLISNTNPNAYLAATLDSHGASPFILTTGRAFLTFGGYIGLDNVVPVAKLQEMVSSGELRFILDNGNLWEKPAIKSWVMTNCSAVQVPGVSAVAQSDRQPSGGPRDQQFTALYDCESRSN